MKPTSLFLISLLAIVTYSCHRQKKDIDVNISLVDKYVKMELTNNTDEDYYIPHMFIYLAIYDKNDVYLNNAYRSHLREASPDYDILVGRTIVPEEFWDKDYYSQKGEYFDEALKKYKEIFLKLNPTVTEEMIMEEYQSSFDQFLELLYVLSGCDGVAIKAGQTLNIYEEIYGLFINRTDTPREKFTIRFMRHNISEFPLSDTIQIDGYRIYTPLPEVNAGYKLYKGKIECSDVIYLDP